MMTSVSATGWREASGAAAGSDDDRATTLHDAVDKSAPTRAADGGAAKKKGGTEELHSRSGRVGFIRPCRLAALSGRRAAQDGCGRALGGPERAGMEGLGEALSAGRAAAPRQIQVETLGRGRSADRVAHVLAERAKPGGSCGHGEAARASARARPFQAMARAVFFSIAAVGLFVGPVFAADLVVKPGDTGTLEYPIENIAAAGTNRRLEEVRLSVIVPENYTEFISFGPITIKEGAGITQPLTIEPGETRTFVIPYQLASNAPEGSPVVQLHVEQLNVFAEPASLDTSVHIRSVLV